MAWVRTSLSVCASQSARDDGARQGIESVIPNAPNGRRALTPAGCRSGLIAGPPKWLRVKAPLLFKSPLALLRIIGADFRKGARWAP